jgi:hypothetical protein
MRHSHALRNLLVGCGTTLLALTANASLRADTLAPYIVGGVRDTSPRDGAGDFLDDAPFIANVNGGQYRALAEYDLRDLPRGTVLSASLTGKVGPNNSVNTGTREHRLELYTGNGVIDLADYAVPAIPGGTFSHASGGSTNYNVDVTGILHNLLAAGADYLGMRIAPVSETLPFDVLYENFPQPTLNFEILPANAHSKQFLPKFDVSVRKEGGAFAMYEGDSSITVQRIDYINYDRRAVLEYDLSSIPVGSQITDAKVVFDLNSMSSSGSSYPEPVVYGYAGNGVAELDDGFRISNQIAVFDPVQALDPFTVDLDHEYIESLVGSSEYFGMVLVGDDEFHSIGFGATEGSGPPYYFYAPAQLMLTYVEPPLAEDFDGDGSVGASDLATWRSAFGQSAAADADGDGDADGADFLLWQRKLGTSASGTSAQAIPEPCGASFGALIAVVLGIAGRCSGQRANGVL